MTLDAMAAADREILVPLHSRRRRRGLLAQKLQHVIAAAGLFFSGVQSLSAGADGLELTLAVGGMLTAGLLIAAFVRDVRAVAGSGGAHAHAAHGPHGIDWTDVFAAGVLFAEAAEKWHLRGHVWRPETLAALATLGVGLFHGRLAARKERRRSLRVTGDGVAAGRRLFGAFTARWNEIAAIEIGEREAFVRRHDRKSRRFNLADLENARDIRAALQEAQRRLGEVPIPSRQD
jgi:hypothetical protein